MLQRRIINVFANLNMCPFQLVAPLIAGWTVRLFVQENSNNNAAALGNANFSLIAIFTAKTLTSSVTMWCWGPAGWLMLKNTKNMLCNGRDLLVTTTPSHFTFSDISDAYQMIQPIYQACLICGVAVFFSCSPYFAHILHICSSFAHMFHIFVIDVACIFPSFPMFSGIFHRCC